ncbi:MAG: DUF1638 domain-containing protein [Puniceicoccaceae bacterium]|nr:MAG: DUF1638 domain-containing protein [Puniceicoccaceae bacterium]
MSGQQTDPGDTGAQGGAGRREPRIALLACDVFRSEVELHGAGVDGVATTRFFEMGLHDQPDRLRAELQAAIDAFDDRDDIEAVALLYGLCGLGTVGLRSGRHPLVIPRAHDCITVFLGSKERYAEHQRACAGCYYYTPGWNRNRRVPGPEKLEGMRAELAERFDPEDVDYLLEAERENWELHHTASYVDLGTADGAEAEAYAQDCAAWLGWRFERLQGDPDLLRDLLRGRWDEARFQIVPPGRSLAHAPDARIMRLGEGPEEKRRVDAP